MMGHLVNRRNAIIVAAIVAILAVVSASAFVAGSTGIGYVGAILAGLATIAPFIAQSFADVPRVGAEYIHSRRPDAIAVALRNSGTGPGYVRAMTLHVSAEDEDDFTVRYDRDEIVLYPRQSVYLTISEDNSASKMMTMGYTKVDFSFHADVYDLHGRRVTRLTMVNPASVAPRTTTEPLTLDEGFWRTSRGQPWRY